MAKLVSKTYGDALFDLAVEENSVDAVLAEVQGVRQTFADHPELTKVFRDPDIGKEEKQDLMEKIFQGRVSDNMVGFLRVVVGKQRFEDLDAILDYVMARGKEYSRIGVASVTSPAPLSDVWKQRIEDRLLQTTGYVKMEMSYQVDPKLIGGLVIRIGDTVVDSSILSKLTDIRRRLMKTSLEQEERMQTS